MGKEKYMKQVIDLFERSPVASFGIISRIINNKGKVKQYDKKLIGQLLAKGKIKRLTKGYYTKFDDASLSVFSFQPAYLGLQDALSVHGIWEQETIPIIITSRKAEPGIRNILGSNVLIRRIEKKYMFGIEHQQQGNFTLPYSDIEKTFIDMIYFKEKMSPEVLSNFKNRLDLKKLYSYLKLYPKKMQERVKQIIEK